MRSGAKAMRTRPSFPQMLTIGALAVSVVSAAGAHNRSDEKMLRYLIREAGFIPQQRDILYRHVNRDESLRADAREPMPLRELTVMIAD